MGVGQLSFYQNKFYFDEHASSPIARDAGFKWDGDTLRWVTRNPVKAGGLRRFADTSAERKLKSTFITDCEPPDSIPYPDHLNPRTFQLESAWHCLTRTPAYVADEAGLGKTVVACLCMNAVPGRTLILCPPFLKYNWRDEILKWVGKDPAIIEPGKQISNDTLWWNEIVILPDSLIINPLVQSMIAEREWEWLFVDEAHRYKEATSKRTKALVGDEHNERSIAQLAHRLVYLSGTPIPNGRPIELFPLLSQTVPEAIGRRSLNDYGTQFCAAKKVTHFERGRPVVHWDYSGSNHLGKLKKELTAKFMIRHRKEDVLPELGPKTRKIVFFDGIADEMNELRAFEKAVLKNHSLDDLLGEDHSLGDIATYRRELGLLKINPAVNYIEDLLGFNDDEKLVVFAHHISVVDGLAFFLEDFNPLTIQGGMSAKEKAKRVAQFQEDDTTRIIIGNMDAMGVGNTLTRSPGVVIVEPSWTPGINEQAEDRVHRLTQKSNVYIRYLVLRNSLDERMLHSVLSKQDAINQVMA